jgi:hypothetical protein
MFPIRMGYFVHGKVYKKQVVTGRFCFTKRFEWRASNFIRAMYSGALDMS